MAEQTADEYNAALDFMEETVSDDGGEDIDMEAVKVAAALGVTEAPSAKTQALLDQHPEVWPDYEEVVMEKLIIKDSYPPREDAAHKTCPYLTMYERTKILGFRASQLAKGAPPYIDVPDYMSSSYDIARAELDAKRLPFIVKRPLPDGTFEYWRLADLILL